LFCSNGDKYEGEWKDDKRNGQGYRELLFNNNISFMISLIIHSFELKGEVLLNIICVD